MWKNDEYHNNYEAMYPEIQGNQELLSFLYQSDRKMEYMHVDLKMRKLKRSQQSENEKLTLEREVLYETLEDLEKLVSEHTQSAEDVASEMIQIDALHEAISLLSKEDRSLLYLRFWYGMSQAEVAEKFSITQQAVSLREDRLLRKLRKMLE
jgi:RNA polymerase sigma factor (sigma-70 family)